MRKIKEILRLHHELGLARREIGRSVSVSPNTVADVIRRAEAAGLSWPLPEDLGEPRIGLQLRRKLRASGRSQDLKRPCLFRWTADSPSVS